MDKDTLISLCVQFLNILEKLYKDGQISYEQYINMSNNKLEFLIKSTGDN